MESLVLKTKRISGKIIPFEYNYFLGISIYKKLNYYQEDVRKLHTAKQIGLYTFSNIISGKKVEHGDNGLDIGEGFIIFRTLDNKISSYLRLGIMENQNLIIKDVLYKVISIKKINIIPKFESKIRFKTLSPVLVRDFRNKKMFISDPKMVQKNLNLIIDYQMKRYFELKNSYVYLDNISATKKTIRISSNGKKESITTGFNIKGTISGSPEALMILYYHGLGSKTSLGLGCWEVE